MLMEAGAMRARLIEAKLKVELEMIDGELEKALANLQGEAVIDGHISDAAEQSLQKMGYTVRKEQRDGWGDPITYVSFENA